ncbi:P5a [Pseudomonas phage phi6]|uniref:p5a n=1 Tax=Cystovirus phi6 TaxID=10879 RepID=A1XX57_9VIRU|nr:P5a [Pseudomonas phage phi6]
MSKDSAFAVQYSLRALGQKVRADGVVGSETRAALDALPENQKKAIVELQALLPKAQSVGNSRVRFTTAEVDSAVPRISQKIGVPASYYQFLIPIENFVVAGGFETTVSGSFRGLGQFNRQTWDGLRRLGRNLPAFEEGSAQLNASLYAIGFLYLENKRAYEASFKGRVFTHEIAYLYHNQGAPAAEQYLTSGRLVYPKQSEAAVAAVAAARNQHVKESWA